MSIENATVAAPVAGGQETATASQAPAIESNNRYDGIIDPDNLGSVLDTGNPDGLVDAPVEAEDADFQQPDPWEGYEDYQIESGRVVKIPSELKDGILRQADYTRKTQAVSAKERELAAREADFVQRVQLSEQEIQHYGNLQQVNAALKQFEGRNWQAEAAKVADDPIAHQELQRQYMQYHELREHQKALAGAITQARQQRSAQAQQANVTRLQETLNYAETKIKGWTPELDNQITTWARDAHGLSKEQLQAAYTPSIYQIVHDAYQWQQSLKRQQTARPTPQPPAANNPTRTVSGKANPSAVFNPLTATMEEYAKDWNARHKRKA